MYEKHATQNKNDRRNRNYVNVKGQGVMINGYDYHTVNPGDTKHH